VRAVADAGPLIHLSWINHLDLLPRIFEDVIVPTTVRDEVLAAPPGTIGLDHIQRALAGGRLRIVETSSDDGSKDLGAGERAALRIAEDGGADLMLSDDTLARAEASRRGVNVMGTIGILLKGRDQGLIAAAFPLLLELRRHGQWLSDELLQAVREQETAP
jgi:predicted nucleic acid-binding protein